MPVPESDRKVIQQALSELRVAIDNATKAQAKNPRLAELLPDLEIFHKAADWALKYNEFFKESEFKSALEVIAEEGPRRRLRQGEAPWTTQKGPVVRAYRSRIDGSIQPYGIVVPENAGAGPLRLDFGATAGART